MTALSMRISLALAITGSLTGLIALAAMAGALPTEARQLLITAANSLTALQPPAAFLGAPDLGLALNLALVGGCLLVAWLIRLFISR